MQNIRVLTLYYHRINALETDYHQICVSPSKFRQQMQYLKCNYQIVRFEDDWTLLNTDAIAITFDDGYLDNYEYALPILEEVGVPATIFISTGTMNQSQELWWDELEYLTLVGNDIPSYFQLKDNEFGYQWDTSTRELRKNCYVSIHHLMKNFADVDKREDWLEQLWNWRGLKRTAREKNLTVSEFECRKLAASKMISIGAHTVHHPSLAVLNREAQEVEIESSIDTLSGILGRKVTLFSYPFGHYGVNYDENTMAICSKHGIVKAASTDSSLWNRSVNSYMIPRKVARNWDIEEFKRSIKEYWEE